MTIAEKIWMGDTVILQDDALFNMLEEPGDSPAHSQSTPLVDIGIKTLDLTRPINLLLYQVAGRRYLFSLTRTIGVGAVAGHKQTCRHNRPDGIDHLTQRLRTTPCDQKDWGIRVQCCVELARSFRK